MNDKPCRYCQECDDRFYNVSDMANINIRGMCVFCWNAEKKRRITLRDITPRKPKKPPVPTGVCRYCKNKTDSHRTVCPPCVSKRASQRWYEQASKK